MALLTGPRGGFGNHKSHLLSSCLLPFSNIPRLPSSSQTRTSGLQRPARAALPSLLVPSAHPPSHPLSCSPLASVQLLRLCSPGLYTHCFFCWNFLFLPQGAWPAAPYQPFGLRLTVTPSEFRVLPDPTPKRAPVHSQCPLLIFLRTLIVSCN